MDLKKVGKKYEYAVSERLGQGAFAEVYKGKNKNTGEEVAIKVIKRAALAKYGDEILDQIHQEVEILQFLVEQCKQRACPFINRIYECIETQNTIYIVLEFCNQGTLYDMLKKVKKIEEKETTFILFQLLQALSLLADKNTAHRDIKPENIFIKDGVYKLGDFGFAGQKSMYQTHLGTYPYMAPEFFADDQYDSKVDVWALGLMTHQLLFGEVYFIGRSQFEVQQKILTKNYQLDDPKYNCSNELKQLLYKMVCKDSKQRISATQALEDKVFDWCRIEPKYLQMMEQEKIFMKQFIDDHSQHSEQQIQIQEEERQKKEEEERQKKLEEELQQQKNQALQNGVQSIKNGINDRISGVILMVQLADYLKSNVIEICRYDILYIYKQALIILHKMKEYLDQKNMFNSNDHKDFNVDSESWFYFYQDINTQQIIDDLDTKRQQIRKKYIDYINYINNFTSQNYPDGSSNIEQITNFNFTKLLDHQLYNEQLYQKIKFFKEDLQKTQNEQIQKQMKKCLLWLYTAYEYEKLCSGKLVDIQKFMKQIDNNDLQGMQENINWP